jgi:D-3-phosphoglycerate dehydrogenase
MLHTALPFLIIDFDSTFIQVESLEALAAYALKGNPNKHAILEEIARVTNLGMEGQITFADSLARRLSLFQPHKAHVNQVTQILRHEVSPSINRNRDFFVRFADRIYIMSNGFDEMICPVVQPFGIRESHVCANTFIYDENGNIIGVEEDNFLAQNQSKVQQLKELCLPGEIYAIGDGYTDYQMKEAGVADKFFAFTENVAREPVTAKADSVIQSFDELIDLLKVQ